MHVAWPRVVVAVSGHVVLPRFRVLARSKLAAFQMEYREHLEGIRSLLADAEAGRTENVVDEAFRRAHSLKGCARAIGLRPAEVVAHRLESLFAQVREGTSSLTP